MNKGRRIFYGWYIVAGSTVVIFMGTFLSVFGPAVLVKPMTAELGWSRTAFFAVQTTASVVAALAAPFVGRRIDRGNPRFLIITGAIVAAASVVGYSQVRSFWLYLLLAGIATPAGMSLCGGVVFNTVVAKWFVRKRGQALATSQAGINLGGMIAPPLVVALLAALDWRLTWVAIGLAILVIVIPAGLLVKRSPEDAGLLPDGESQPRKTGPLAPSGQEPEWAWHQLRRTGAFWMIALLFGIAGMATVGLGLHTYPFLTDRGLSPPVAAAMASSISISGLVFRPLWGYILDRWQLRFSSLLMFSALALSVTGLVLSANPAAVITSLSIRGLASGGYGAVQPMLSAAYFGRRSLG